jgi:hypothetical protein
MPVDIMTTLSYLITHCWLDGARASFWQTIPSPAGQRRIVQRQTLAFRVLVATIALAACSQPAVSILDQKLSSGATIRALVAGDSSAVVLIYNASTCFACGTPIPLWRELARKGSVRFVLVLTDTPSADDARALQIQRIPVSGIFADRPSRADSIPSEYLVRSGVIVARAEGLQMVRSRRLWKHVPGGPQQGVGGS